MILIVLFFFLTLFTLLLFGFPSHFAHCSSCSFLSASFPLERHSPSAPLFHSYAWFSCSYVCLVYTLSLACICLLCSFFFWLHSPSSPFLSPFHYQHLPRLCLCALRQGLPLASNSGTHIHPLRRSCTCASPATPSRDSYLLSRRHHRCRRSSPEASWVLAGSLKHTRINGANASLPSVHNITICILFTNDFFTLIDFQTKTVYPSSHPSSFHIHALQIHNIIYYIHTYIPHCEKKVILPGFLEKTDSLYGLLLSHVLSCYE